MISSINRNNFDYLENLPKTHKLITEGDFSNEIINTLDTNSKYIQELVSTDKNDIIDSHLSNAIISGEINNFSVHYYLFGKDNFTRMLLNPNSHPFQRYED